TNSDKDGMFLGSVSHRVASPAKCPVLVVSGPHSGRAAHPQQPGTQGFPQSACLFTVLDFPATSLTFIHKSQDVPPSLHLSIFLIRFSGAMSSYTACWLSVFSSLFAWAFYSSLTSAR